MKELGGGGSEKFGNKNNNRHCSNRGGAGGPAPISKEAKDLKLLPYDLVYCAENVQTICPGCGRIVWDDDLFVNKEGKVVCCEECYLEYIQKLKNENGRE